MGTGYIRTDTSDNIADTKVIDAADLDSEWDALAAAFVAATGHTHDGTAAEGGPVSDIGPAQDLVVSISAVLPKTDNTLDIGSETKEFKNLYIDGTAYLDSADIGSLTGAAIGADVQAWDADLDVYAGTPLTSVELAELQNIGTTTITTTQWGYVGSADQGVATTDDSVFSTVKLSANAPVVELEETDGAADETRVRWRMAAGTLHQQLLTDDGLTSNAVLSIARSAEVFDYMQWYDSSAVASMRLDANGNLIIGGTTTGASSVGNLTLKNGTAPTGSIANGVILFSEDVSASAELRVRDEAGNETTLSPHNFSSIPGGASEEMAWSFSSERNGKKLGVDMMKAMRLIEELTGEQLVHISEEV